MVDLDAVEKAINKASRIFATYLKMLKSRLNNTNMPGNTISPCFIKRILELIIVGNFENFVKNFGQNISRNFEI
jgi:hypothetical protein